MFSINVFIWSLCEYFFHSQHFVEKDENHLEQDGVDGVEERLVQIQYFLLRDSCGWGLALSFRDSKHFSYWQMQDVFFDFHAHVAAVESVNLHWVSNCSFTTQKEQYRKHSIIFLLGHGNSSSSIPVPFAWNIVIKTHFCYLYCYSWERRLLAQYMRFSLCFSIRVWGTQTPS